jgi:murein DD-endopeptidase MepM/ murein hydrolase activator NlpD
MRRWASYIVGVIAVALLTLVSGDSVTLEAAPFVPVVAPPMVAAPKPAAPSASLPIAGWIIDDDGAPIAGVNVTRRDAGGAIEASAVSEATGAFRLPPSSAPRQQLMLDGPDVFPAELAVRAGGPEPRILLARRVHLAVRVTADDALVAGAVVEISDGSGPALATATSDREGIARFGDLMPGPYELWARREASVSPLVRIADAASAHDVALALAPAGTVHGQVTADGPLPAGGTVQLAPLDVDHATRVATLDAEGRFTIDGLPHGHWRVEISVPDHVSEGDRVLDAKGPSDELALRVARAGVASGSVVDPAGAPVAGATIVLRQQGSATSAVRSIEDHPALASTRLRWVHPLAGPRQMPVIGPARFGAARPGNRATECGLGHCGVDIGSKRGTIVHAAADGEVVAAYTEIRGEAGRFVAIDHAGGLRTYYMHLDQLRPGLEVHHKVRAGDPLGTIGTTGFALENPHLHFALTQEHHGRAWYIDPEPMLRHAVVLATARSLDPIDPSRPRADPAAPVIAVAPHREVAPDPAPARTLASDAKGLFRLDGVAPGSYIAVAFAEGFASVASAPFVVRSGAETDGIAITLRPGVPVSGRVTGRDGPVDGALVVATTGFGETVHKVAMAYTTHTGEYALRSLTGKVTLTVSAAGHGDVERTITLDDTTPGRPHEREDFALVIEDGKLRGQVLAPDGGVAGAVAVRVLEGPSRRGTVSDPRGEFALDRVASGSYLVELTSADYPPLRARLETGTWKELRFSPGGGVRILLADARSRAPLAAARVEATGPGGQAVIRTTDPQGLAELRGLATGEWSVQVHAPGYTAGREVVTISATRVWPELRLDLSRSAVAGGVVRDRYGRRVAGARVSIGGVSTRTDADGNFRIADAPAGPGILEAELEGARGALRVELAPGDERVTLNVDLTR